MVFRESNFNSYTRECLSFLFSQVLKQYIFLENERLMLFGQCSPPFRYRFLLSAPCPGAKNCRCNEVYEVEAVLFTCRSMCCEIDKQH